MKETLLAQIEYFLNMTESIQLAADNIQNIRVRLNDLLTDEENYELTAKIKSKIQEEANIALNNFGHSGLVIGATGIGKSKIAIDNVLDLIARDFNSRILLVVPTEKLRDEGWRDEFKKWGYINSWDFITPICYASLHTITKTDWDLIILDECHNITEANAEFFLGLDNNWIDIIALTATEPRNIIKLDLLKKIGLKIVYEINIDTAVKLGLVAPYEVVCIGVELDSKNAYIKAGNKKKPFMTTETGQYHYLTKLCIQAPGKLNVFRRMRFIYELRSKTDAALKILLHLIPLDLKTLIFCGSIKQAEEVCEYTYHSKRDDEDFKKFIKGIINKMACCDALNEGHNIDGLDCGMMLKVTKSDLRFIQRTGRHIRYRPGHMGKIIIIYAKDTVDEVWVKEAIKGVDTKNITWIEYNKLRKGEQTIKF